MSETQQVELSTSRTKSVSLFSSIQEFEDAQRMAVPLTKASMVPKEFQNNPANALIALEYAHRLGESPFVIMQNVHVINGKPGLKSEYLINRINQSGLFSSRLKFKYEGAKNTDARSCTAWVKDSDGDILEGTEVSIAMAKKEGWYGRTGSKWPSMSEQMLAYRAAAFFQRLHAPEIAMGVQTAEEIIDIGYANVIEEPAALAGLNEKLTSAKIRNKPATQTEKQQGINNIEDAEIIKNDSPPASVAPEDECARRAVESTSTDDEII